MSAAASAQIDRRRLARVLGMLGSAHDGEVAAAGRRAAAIVRDAGISWQDLLDPPAPQAPWFPTPPLDADAIIDAALTQPARLTEWECNFVRSLAGRRPRVISERQRGVLARIAGKINLRRRP